MSHCFDVCRERQGVVQGHAKVLSTLGGQHCGVVNRDAEVFQQAGHPQKEEELPFFKVELEVDGRLSV